MKPNFYFFVLCGLIFANFSFAQQNAFPVFRWAKQGFGTGEAGLLCMDTDIAQNIVVGGFVTGAVNIGTEAKNNTLTSQEDAPNSIFAKYDVSGQLLWAKVLKGKYSNIQDIKLDKQGNIIITGVFIGAVDFDPNTGSKTLDSGKEQDMFLAKYSATGSLLWVQQLGNPAESFDIGYDIEIAANNQIYVVGMLWNYQSTSGTIYGDYIAKYDVNGSLLFLKPITTWNSCAFGLAKDQAGNLIVAGYHEHDFSYTDPKGNAIQLKNKGSWDGYVAKLTPDGSPLWMQNIGGASAEQCNDVVVDSRNYITVLGSGSGTFSFNPTQSQSAKAGKVDAFYAQYKPDGTLSWAKTIGTAWNDYAIALTVDAQNQVYGVYASCSDQLWWSIYLDGFDAQGNRTLKQSFGENMFAFWKSSCGTANFFPYCDRRNGLLYLCGEGRAWGVDFDMSAANEEKLFTDANITKPFLVKYTLAAGGTNPIDEPEPEPQPTEPESESAVTIYEQENYKGASKSFKLGRYNLQDLGIGNDRLSSLKIPEGWRVRLFEHADFKGKFKDFTNSTAFVGADWNDKASSLVIEPNYNVPTNTNLVTIYQHSDYKGASKSFKLGKYNLQDLGIGNDQLSSLKVPQGWRVRLYEHADFRGKFKDFTSSTAFAGADWNDKTSSIIVEEAGTDPVEPEPIDPPNPSEMPSFKGCATGAENVSADNASFEKEVMKLTNQERAKEGKSALEWSAGLARAARYHAADMVTDNYFEHDSYDKVNGQLVKVCGTFDRIGKFGNGYAENIAGGSSPEQVVQMWMNSPGHRRNILSGNSKIGVGYYKGTWVQVFGY
jgi:uncharacterized protein YkwD